MKYFALALIGLFLITSAHTFAQKSGGASSIGFVDSETIIKEIPEAQEADKIIKEYQKKLQDSLLKMQADFEAKFKQYDKQKSMMPAEQQQKQEEALKAQQMALYQFREEKFSQQGELAQMTEKFLSPIREKVKKAIEDVAKEEKMSFVFDKASASMLYAESKYDLTYKVLDNIKRGSK